MNLYAQLRTLEFEASMNEQLTLVRQMVKTPSIVKYLINPRDEENRSVAFEDFLTFQNSFLSKSVFWTSDADLEFWSGMEYSYTVNPSDPNDYWYNMTLYETDEYNFNINYNEALNATMLWVNAVVRDSTGKPVGMAGTGIPLQNFIDTMYGGLNKSTTMYLYNDKDEVTGALDSSILKDKLSVYDMLPYLKSTDTKPENLSFSSTREGEYLVAPLSLVRWHMALFMPYTFADCIKNAVVPFVTSALIIAVIAILATAILSIIGQLTVLKNAVAELSSGNADLTKRVSVSGRSIFRVFGELVSEENNFIKKLQELVGAMKNSKQSLITAGNQLNEGTGDTETAIEQISESINGVSENLSRQNRCVEQTLESVQVILGKIKSLETLVVSQGQAAKEAASAVETMISNIDEVNNSVDKMASSFDTLASDAESGAKTQDIYGYLFDGRSDSDITLKEGDVVIVPPYVDLVQAAGHVKRPMFYELADGESLSDLIRYAGGFGSKAYRDEVRVIRRMGAERQIYTVGADAFSSFAMEDGDEVFVNETLERFANKVEVRGAVFRPGMFELGGRIATVRQLVGAAGGPTEDAFLGRAVLVREREDLTFESLPVDLAGILRGSAEDILLRKNDILTVSANKELVDPGSLTINGYVRAPGVFPYAANTTVEDLILLAGGLIDGASTARVDVVRRVMDPASLMPRDTISETFSFALSDSLAIGGAQRFLLQPYDVVSVRKSPTFQPRRIVRVEGEVAFPGEYVLQTEEERVSDLIGRAGGLTGRAFLRGGTLTRKWSEEERNVQEALMRMTKNGMSRDTINVNALNVTETFAVGVELDKAVARPGSEYDPILRDGDRIFVPEQLSTVRISGNVLFPNTVVYVPGKPLRYYISAAGGYGFRARRGKTYIIYMNGNVRTVGSAGASIEPGCEIVVPSRPERDGMSVAEVMSLSSSAATMATMVATLVNLFR